jgi:hypothetical protein
MSDVDNRPPPRDNVVVFKDLHFPETPVDVAHLVGPAVGPSPTTQTVTDLRGKPKVVMAIGRGQTGKTTLLRWMCERALARDEQLVLATLDPINRELTKFFPDAMSPGAEDPRFWLDQFLMAIMEAKRSAAVDFGGGDTSLARLAVEVPDLQPMIESAGLEPVAFHLLTPDSEDVTSLAAVEQAGFQPTATALVLNIGRSSLWRDPRNEFANIRRHSVYRAAVARGAVEIWMPTLYSAKAIKDRRISFQQALTGQGPGEGMVLGLFDRSRTRHWLAAMEEAFAPIASWLP